MLFDAELNSSKKRWLYSRSKGEIARAESREDYPTFDTVTSYTVLPNKKWFFLQKYGKFSRKCFFKNFT